MAKKDPKAAGPGPEELQPFDPVSEAPTGEFPDIIALEPEQAELTDTVIVETQPEGSGDDVYVILPEGEASDIPVVETQVLEDAEGLVDTAAETAPLDDDPSISRVAVLDRNPSLDDTQSTGEAVGEEQETQTLDDLATEMEDDVLASAAGSNRIGDTSIAAGIGGALGDDEPAAGSLGHVSEAPFAKKRSIWKVALPMAAAVLVSAGGYFYFLGGWPEGLGTTAGSVAVQVPPSQGSSTTAGGTPPVDGAVATAATADAIVAAKQAFREKVLLALDLGYGGEAKNE